MRTVAAEILAGRGFETLTAGDREEALEVFRTHRDKIDLALLDMTMPRLGGPEALRELLRLGARVKAVFTSDYSEHDFTEHFAGDPSFRLVEKPYRSEKLLSAIRAALEEASR